MHITGIALLCVLILLLLALTIGFASIGALNLCAYSIVVNLVLVIATSLLYLDKVSHNW